MVEPDSSGHHIGGHLVERPPGAERVRTQPQQGLGDRHFELHADHPRRLMHGGAPEPTGSVHRVAAQGRGGERRGERGGIGVLPVRQRFAVAQNGEYPQSHGANAQREAVHAQHTELPRRRQQYRPPLGRNQPQIGLEDGYPVAQHVGPGTLAQRELKILEPPAQLRVAPQRLGLLPRLHHQGHRHPGNPEGPRTGRAGIAPLAQQSQGAQHLGHAVTDHLSPFRPTVRPSRPPAKRRVLGSTDSAAVPGHRVRVYAARVDDRPLETGARGRADIRADVRADVHAVVRRLADVLEPRPVWCGPDDAEIHDVVIAEPSEALDGTAGTLVLAVGAREAEAVDMVAAAAGAGAGALAVRVGDDGLPEAVRAAADGAGIAVIGLPRGLRWDRAEAEIRAVLAAPAGEFTPSRSGDLFSLAQTVATLTQGLVSLEDGAHRVLAYAGPVDEADELRRATILGRSCPEPYLALLRRLGVHQRVRAGDEVVTVDEQPDLGARRRLVIGVNAGRRPLGTIWVQEGAKPLAERAPQMLRGAARIAAVQLVDHYFQGDSGARLASREELSHGLLTGRFDAAALAAHLGIDPAAGADVVAVDLRDPAEDGDAVRADARRAEAAGIVSVHVAAHRENALVAQACGQIYAVLPTPAAMSSAASSAAYEAEGALVRWADELVATLRRLTGTRVQAVLAGRAERLADVPAVKLCGHRALQLLARTPETTVGTHTRLAPALLIRDTLELLDRSPRLRFPAVAALVSRDRDQGTDLARSLLRYLDAFGDVTAVAKRLNVHPNTLRYRVRRAVALTGLDLDDPEHRLAATLQLRLDLDARDLTDPAFPGA